jgi:S-adenosylmethionine:tRNA ribosyltransferase-isomerase
VDLTRELTEDDVLVINQTKVFPARLMGTKLNGGKVEILLLSEGEEAEWEGLSKPGLAGGTEVRFSEKLTGMVVKPNNEEGVLKIKFSVVGERLKRMIDDIGQVPLPPYIKSQVPQAQLKQDYQTVYANEWGSAAAPTAGMHFTKASLKKLADEGVGIVPITLHIGLGTFQPVTNEHIKRGSLHTERFCITRQTAEQILKAKRHGKRIIAVGTTSARALESAAKMVEGKLTLKTDWQETKLFIKPPHQFKVVDSLITNFHLPKSSLLMLAAAFAAKPNTTREFTGFASSLIGQVYREAIREKYRFFSFGDAMWIH